MKKKLLLFIALGFSALTYAETFKVYHNGTEVIKNSELFSTKVESTDWYSTLIPSGLSIENISSSEQQITATVIIGADQVFPTDSKFEFCFDRCTNITTVGGSSISTAKIPANTVYEGMDYALILKEGNYGTLKVRYIFQNGDESLQFYQTDRKSVV